MSRFFISSSFSKGSSLPYEIPLFFSVPNAIPRVQVLPQTFRSCPGWFPFSLPARTNFLLCDKVLCLFSTGQGVIEQADHARKGALVNGTSTDTGVLRNQGLVPWETGSGRLSPCLTQNHQPWFTEVGQPQNRRENPRQGEPVFPSQAWWPSAKSSYRSMKLNI